MTDMLFIARWVLAFEMCNGLLEAPPTFLRSSTTDGFPMQMVDTSSPDRADAIDAIAREIIPHRWYFGTRQDNVLLCERTGFSGWRSVDLRHGVRPPADVIASWVHNTGALSSALALCPQVVMLAMLFHFQNVLSTPEIADLHEAGKLHLQYSCVKEWFFMEALPGEPWEALIADWPIQEAEINVFRLYKRLLSSTYNELYDSFQSGTEVTSTGGAVGLESVVATEAAAAFYNVCPQARGADHITAFAGSSASAAPGGAPGSGPLADIVEGLIPFGMAMVGNALSLYWQARGLAALARAPFRATGGRGDGYFVQYLPRTAPAPAAVANITDLQEGCARCWREAHWRWPHLCLGAWSRIQGAIRAGTLGALRQSGAEAAALAVLGPHDVAVHLRCFPFFSGEYPLAGFSLLSALPPRWAAQPDLRFLLVSGTLGPICQQVADAMEAHLHGRFPQATVVQRFGATAELGVMAEDLASSEAAQLDFAILTYAPVLVRTAGTFSLWAALARGGEGGAEGPGAVLSAPNPPRTVSGWEWQTADFGASWTWVPSPLLTPDVVERHNFSFAQPRPWIRWLESH